MLDILNPEKHIIESAMCIRLRDDSSSLFPVLKDEKIVSRALFGLVDEKKIIVQVVHSYYFNHIHSIIFIFALH